MEANWTVTLLIGSLLSIPISILANILTPVFQKWFEKQAGSVRRKSLARLKTEYERVKNFREQPDSLQLVVSEYSIKGVLLLCALVMGIAFFAIAYFTDNMSALNSDPSSEFIKLGSFFMFAITWIFTCVFILTFWSSLFDLLADFSRLKQFEKFEKEFLVRIHELENPKRGTNP